MKKQDRFPVIFGKAFRLIGFVFLGTGLLFLCLSLPVSGDAGQALRICGIVFTLLGVVFCSTGVVSMLIAREQGRRIDRLMNGGICYEAEVVRTYNNQFLQIYTTHPLIVECIYKDVSGKTYLVRSGNVWPDGAVLHERDVMARVWVNPQDPRDYFVEVWFGQMKEKANLKYDYDFR